MEKEVDDELSIYNERTMVDIERHIGCPRCLMEAGHRCRTPSRYVALTMHAQRHDSYIRRLMSWSYTVRYHEREYRVRLERTTFCYVDLDPGKSLRIPMNEATFVCWDKPLQLPYIVRIDCPRCHAPIGQQCSLRGGHNERLFAMSRTLREKTSIVEYDDAVHHIKLNRCGNFTLPGSSKKLTLDDVRWVGWTDDNTPSPQRKK